MNRGIFKNQYCLVLILLLFVLFGSTYTVVKAQETGKCLFSWEQNLAVGSIGYDVLMLQKFLNTDSRTQLAQFGPGSPGQESQYFGPITKAAVIRFQNIYAANVLHPIGLTQGTGYVGSMTRAFLSARCADKNMTKSDNHNVIETSVNTQEQEGDPEEVKETQDVDEVSVESTEEEVYKEEQVVNKREATTVDSSIKTITNGDGEAVKTIFEMSFTLSAIGDTMYIPFGATRNVANKGLLFDVEDPNTNNTISGLSDSNLSSVVVSSTADRESGYYRLNSGESAEFTFQVSFKSNSGAVIGAHRLQLQKIRYTDEIGGFIRNFKLLPEEKFESGIGVLDA